MKYEHIYEDLNKFTIKGVGPKTMDYLKNLEINTLFDLFYDFPVNYEDRTNFKLISDVKEDEFVTIKGTIIKTQLLKIGAKRQIFKAYLFDGVAVAEISWFQMPYLKNILHKDMEVYITGDANIKGRLNMTNPEFSFKKQEGVLPIYRLCKGLSQNVRRKIMESALAFSNLFEEIIPNEMIEKYGIIPRNIALKEMHFPTNPAMLEKAKKRFLLEELLLLQLTILKRRYELENINDKYYVLDNRDLVKRYIEGLGFELTNSQKSVITEIHKEISSGKIVNRLIQGDVGSGKSVVAFIFMLYMASNNYQSTLMAPTEVLAEQHYNGIKEQFKELGLNIALLVGSQSKKIQEKIIENLELGKIDILIGTHALIYERVKFKNLGLIVIDEQHKFGVKQRKLLKDKGLLSNLIAMSATPIPRSLALTLYGDLDISVIDEMPKGRKKVLTEIVEYKNIDQVFKKIAEALDKKEQCYVIAPLIENSEKLNAVSATEIYEKLTQNYLPNYKISLLHGKLKSKEKEEIINSFNLGLIDILVATTVVEVGVNVVNATRMVILNADRFGLSQLHQLRGRIGRGKIESKCYLVNCSYGQCERLEVLARTSDGFEIAEEDLKIRKAGEILGTKQSGNTQLSFIDLLKDVKTINMVRNEVINYLQNKKEISENLSLEMQKRFEDKSDLN